MPARAEDVIKLSVQISLFFFFQSCLAV